MVKTKNSSTRKKNSLKKSTIMTVPKLRKAFEQIDIDTKKILQKHPINEESISEFQKCWKQVFHKNIDSSTAESYLQLQSKTPKKGGSKTRKARKMSGGVATLDYTLRPGIDGTHGNYLPYVSSGLSFYDNINQIAMDQDCGKIDITPKLDVMMGSDSVKSGGGSFTEGRLISPTVPPSLVQDAQDYYIGRPLSESSSILNAKYRGV